MHKLVLSAAVGFFVTLIFIFAFAYADDLRLFRDHAAQASRAAFSEIFHTGTSEHMAAEIPLTGNSLEVPDVRSETRAMPIAATSTKNISPKTVTVPHLDSATSSANKNKSPHPYECGNSSTVLGLRYGCRDKPAENIAATPPVSSPEKIIAIKISEIMPGSSSSPAYEFIKLINLGNTSINMTGWSIKKKTASGSESTLVSASRFAGKTILPHGYFLFANSGGWRGTPVPDILWPASYSLSYTSNTITLYAPGDTVIDIVSWSIIPSGKSYARIPESGNQFIIQNVPTPKSSGQ